MVKQIVRDTFFLRQPSEEAVPGDIATGQDLQDTLRANQEHCVGMAANMIGVRKRIIIVNMGPVNLVMYNPRILRKEGPFETEEGCLSLSGVRKTTRYKTIELEYLDQGWNRHKQRFVGWTAQIIQHEMDHLNGVLI